LDVIVKLISARLDWFLISLNVALASVAAEDVEAVDWRSEAKSNGSLPSFLPRKISRKFGRALEPEDEAMDADDDWEFVLFLVRGNTNVHFPGRLISASTVEVVMEVMLNDRDSSGAKVVLALDCGWRSKVESAAEDLSLSSLSSRWRLCI
jgi:hypothetical protein